MYVYTGNFNWQQYSKNDLIVLILPNGPVRDSDPAYLFTFWGTIHGNFNDQNWSRLSSVSKVSRNNQNDDVFTISDGWWWHQCTATDSYQKMVLTMFSSGGSKQEMALDLQYQTEQDRAEDLDLHVWTGKVNWDTDITNQPYVIVAPEGLGTYGNSLPVFAWLCIA